MAAAPVDISDGYSFICGSSLGAAPGVYGCTETPPSQTCSQWCFMINWLSLHSHCPAPFMHPLRRESHQIITHILHGDLVPNLPQEYSKTLSEHIRETSTEKKLLLLWSLNGLLLYSGQCRCFMPITLFNHHNSLWIKTIRRKEQVPGLPGRWCVCVCLSPSCVWLCLPMDCQPPGSSVHGILQAKILEWGAIAFSRRSSQPRGQTSVSCTADRFFTIWVNREVERP